MKNGLVSTVIDHGIQIILLSDSVEQDARLSRHLAMILPSRSQLIRDSSLTKTDLLEIATCRGDQHRLGFAYQLGFVRVFQRFPVQQPLEICEELLSFVALQTGIDGGRLSDYASWQQTVFRHQIRIREYVGLRSFDPDQARGLEQFLYEESCRLEQTSALLARAREYLKQKGTLFPAESVLMRIIGKQRRRAREAIATRVAQELPRNVSRALDKLLEVEVGIPRLVAVPGDLLLGAPLE